MYVHLRKEVTGMQYALNYSHSMIYNPSVKCGRNISLHLVRSFITEKLFLIFFKFFLLLRMGSTIVISKISVSYGMVRVFEKILKISC